jgi:mannose-6-phosphate isomerase
MKDVKQLVREPIFFERNRVYRIYLGGKPYKNIFNDVNGYDDGTDNMFPEEWVASKVKAINPKYFGKRDGVSVVKDTDIFFDDLLNDYSAELLGNRKYDCLVKFLDSAIRLPFQVHPTKDFSRKHFNSEYGKTEAWLVVATRPGAKLYFGFKDKMTKELLSELEDRSETEKDIMTGILAGVDAKPGDIWLIKAGLIHAIGAGCTIIEVQEPTDFTIQPERWCGDYHISYNEEYIGLDKSTALDCINYDIYGEKAIEFAKVNPTVEIDTENYKKEVMISYADTPCFGEVRHTVKNGGSFVMAYAPSVYICLDGEAVIKGDGYEKKIKKGDYFYLPFVAEGKFTVYSDTEAVLIECLPSKQN